jgi:hypothetical protein
MARIDGSLWRYNLVKVVVIDVTEDYELMQPPLPSECYPVLRETLLPAYKLRNRLPALELVDDFLYDWHDAARTMDEHWYVGVVHKGMVERLESSTAYRHN